MVKRKVGRPTGYGPWAVEKAREYITWCRENKKIPYIEELADEWLDCDEDTITNWSKHKEFFGTVKRIKMRQKLELMKGDGAMKIFQLKVNHGFIETSNINQNVDGDLNIRIIDDTKHGEE